jgi:hypothetical protein
MEHMLRLFYEDLTGSKLHEPTFLLDSFLGEGVREDNLRCLEYVANMFHVNPRPRLVLVVEGRGEELEIPRLFHALSGAPLTTRAIALRCLAGVAGFTGSKAGDKYGAMPKLVDEYRGYQTIVYFVLDHEGGASEMAKRLTELPSQYGPETITKGEFIKIWDRCIEFDNFTDDEIATALDNVAEGAATFTAEEVRACRECFFYGTPRTEPKTPADKLFQLSDADIASACGEIDISIAPAQVQEHRQRRERIEEARRGNRPILKNVSLTRLYERKIRRFFAGQLAQIIQMRALQLQHGTSVGSPLRPPPPSLPKKKLLKLLFDLIHDELRRGELKRPIVTVLRQVQEIASLNHQPGREDARQRNQAGGYLGTPLRSKKKK